MIYVRRVIGDSMLPKLKAGQLVLAVKARRPKIGDVVIARHSGLEKIKRLAKVRSGEVYLLGDNPSHSTDSRTLGWLSDQIILARVIWPRF